MIDKGTQPPTSMGTPHRDLGKYLAKYSNPHLKCSNYDDRLKKPENHSFQSSTSKELSS